MPAPTSPLTVGELAEEEILARILARLGPSPVDVGPGDDAAVLRLADPRVVVTTDTLVHGPDFRLAWSRGRDLGAKAAAVNLADVAAMGARPVALFVALMMPDDTTIEFVEELATGLREACEELAPGCAVAGGDLTVSDTLAIAVTAIGDLPAGRRPVLRSGARSGQVVAIAGETGAAAAGLALLFERFRDPAGAAVPVDGALLDEREASLVSAQLRPCPPIAAGVRAADAGATAMMDVSDGLIRDARRMAAASGVSIDLRTAALGPDPALALSGGEDHALLAVFPAEAPIPAEFRVIGTVGDRAAGLLLVDGVAESSDGGWDPYRDWDGQAG
ncbi:thiamine-phosphate kinase [Microbacterium radiodurans]|uniref:Thiamine-monophosphate kinase n=1 Tax=Microbacterium radiodurans TaxID=661398 RepID=A0A5J5ISQ5_9MICO|nr:thiamine-phosphate kinase [Microbacterium radiodurans]KAA9086918.1 thiamine-phosphate kinase [Microbacterium radiodurans]